MVRTVREFVNSYLHQGFEPADVADALMDGAALAAYGISDEDQDMVEDAYGMLIEGRWEAEEALA